MNEAILFPGQGAQFEGMGRDWAEAHTAAGDTWKEADDILGFSLSKACWEGGDQVNRTDISQPGILVTSVATVRALEATGFDRSKAPLAAGLSLGEYSALWCAGSLDFPDALRLVRLRGEAMQAASEQVSSGMVSLLGADQTQATNLAEVGAAHGICQVANLNAPGQIIVSGELAALEAIEGAAREHGIRRVRRLVVAGGFHSECMRPAADALAEALANTPVRQPKIPVISNVTATPAEDPGEIRRLLESQVCSPVLWERSMRWALGNGICTFLEPAPGAVLGGIMRKIDPEARVRSLAKPQDLVPGA